MDDLAPIEVKIEEPSQGLGINSSVPEIYPNIQEIVALEPIPWKIFALCVFLTIVGIALIIMSFFDSIKRNTPAGSVLYWIVGVLLIITGVIYIIKILRAWKTTDPDKRKRILEGIPFH